MGWMTKEKWVIAVTEALDSVNVEDEPDGVVTLPRLLKALVAVRQTEMEEESDTLASGDGKRIKSTDPTQSDLRLAEYLRAILDEAKHDAIARYGSPRS